MKCLGLAAGAAQAARASPSLVAGPAPAGQTLKNLPCPTCRGKRRYDAAGLRAHVAAKHSKQGPERNAALLAAAKGDGAAQPAAESAAMISMHCTSSLAWLLE